MVRNEDEVGQAEMVWTCQEERPEECRKIGKEMELSGKRKRGRPKRKFIDVVKKDRGEVGAREKGH